MSLKVIIENFLDRKELEGMNSYGVSTRIEKDCSFLRNEVTIEEADSPYELIVLEMVTPTLDVKSLTRFLMEAKRNLSDDGVLVFDFIEETRPMLTVAKKMDSWRGKEEEEVYCYTLIDIASALTALGMKIKGLEKVGSIGEKQIVAIFASKDISS